MTMVQTINTLAASLAPVAGECAQAEAERILTFLLDCPRSDLFLCSENGPDPETMQEVERIAGERLTGKPLAYALGSAYFYNQEFKVTPDVLIPRPETELLVEAVLNHETDGSCRFLDVGTGSGCLAAVLMGERRGWRGIGIDRSLAALAVARRNCAGIPLLCADALSAVKAGARFDFMVSNPPYIASQVIDELPPSVRDFEPGSALDGGGDGLDFYRLLASDTPRLLKENGVLYCEIGYDQGESVPAIFADAGWSVLRVKKDLQGHPRVVQARRPA